MELPITLEEFSPHTINTFPRGYHEHMSVWMPQIDDDSLFCRREPCNEYDEYAAAIVATGHLKREEVVGHVPLFLRPLTRSFACPDRIRVAKFQEKDQTEGLVYNRRYHII